MVSCPVGAIQMEPNKQGFLYPVIDQKKCIHCGKCLKVCAFNSERAKSDNNNVLSAYAVKHLDEEIRAASRSGGVFTSLSDRVLSEGGVVYGCVLNDNREAVHIRAETQEQRDRCRGSKYIQSRIDGVLAQVRLDLQQGRRVLFSGTACQVDTVARYCGDLNTEKLLLVDIVCYGVPSSKVWAEYLDYLSAKYKKQISAVEFRDKRKFGWDDHRETVYFTDGTEYSGAVYKQLFADRYILRKDCFACPYKNLNRVGDITLADCWGIAEHYREFDDNKGVSLVLLNTTKGQDYFSGIKEISCIAVEIEKVLQPALCKNWNLPDQYTAFWNYYEHHSFDKSIKKYVLKEDKPSVRIKRKVCRVLKRLKRVFGR